MKKLLVSVAAFALSTSLALAEVVLGTGAVSQSTAGNESQTLGGAGSLGNGIALSGSLVVQSNRSTGAALGTTIGLASGSATDARTTGRNQTTNFSASAGGAGGFSGSASGGGGSSTAFAFGGLGVFQP